MSCYFADSELKDAEQRLNKDPEQLLNKDPEQPLDVDPDQPLDKDKSTEKEGSGKRSPAYYHQWIFWCILAYVYESYTLIIYHLVDHKLEVSKDSKKPLDEDKVSQTTCIFSH